MSSTTILTRSTTTPSRTASLTRKVTEPSWPAPGPVPPETKPRHWWSRRNDDTTTERSPRVIDLKIRSVAMWPRGYR